MDALSWVMWITMDLKGSLRNSMTSTIPSSAAVECLVQISMLWLQLWLSEWPQKNKPACQSWNHQAAPYQCPHCSFAMVARTVPPLPTPPVIAASPTHTETWNMWWRSSKTEFDWGRLLLSLEPTRWEWLPLKTVDSKDLGPPSTDRFDNAFFCTLRAGNSTWHQSRLQQCPWRCEPTLPVGHRQCQRQPQT